MLRRLLPALALAAASAGAADAGSLRVHYGVSLIGLTIGAGELTGSIEPSSYRLQVSAKLSGLASMLSSSRTSAVATGALSGGHVLPATYANTSANSSATRTIRIAMNAGTVTGTDIAPPWDPNVPRVPITDAQKQHVLDPLSAFVMAVPPGAPVGPAACNRTLPIFDGGVRFDLALSFVGTRHVAAKGLDSEAAVCAVRYIPVAGQKVDSKSSQFMADNRNLEVWLVPLSGTRFVIPFRVSVRTMAGTVVVETDEVSLQGADRAAAP